jgi:hypothetical protein
LVSRLTPDNAKVNLGVLEVAHSIFKRWRPLFASDDLYTEINHVLSKFGGPFVQLLAVYCDLHAVASLHISLTVSIEYRSTDSNQQGQQGGFEPTHGGYEPASQTVL